MATSGLQDVVQHFLDDPKGSDGFESGVYAVRFGKIWRGNKVIGYATNSSPPVPPAPKANADPNAPPDAAPEAAPVDVDMTAASSGPLILSTSQTTNEERRVFDTTKAAPPSPKPSMPPMSLDSPDGQAAQGQEAPSDIPDAGSAERFDVGGSSLPGPQSAPKDNDGEATDLAGVGNELDPNHKEEEDDDDPVGLKKVKRSPRRAARESLELLDKARLDETRRKYIKLTACMEFDVDSKRQTNCEVVSLYVLPVNRSAGRFELYDFKVTEYCAIPSQYSIERAITQALAEDFAFVNVNKVELQKLAKHVHKIIDAAKTLYGGCDIEESVKEELDRYLFEIGSK